MHFVAPAFWRALEAEGPRGKRRKYLEGLRLEAQCTLKIELLKTLFNNRIAKTNYNTQKKKLFMNV